MYTILCHFLQLDVKMGLVTMVQEQELLFLTTLDVSALRPTCLTVPTTDLTSTTVPTGETLELGATVRV